MHSHAIGEEQHHHEHKALRKKILFHYKEMGAEDIIEYSEKSDDFYETSDYCVFRLLSNTEFGTSRTPISDLPER